MERDAKAEQGVTRLGESADRVFHQVEIVAYILLGLLLAVAAGVGMGGTAMLLLHSLQANADADSLVIAIDRLLFVLMMIEILHTVRVSFRSGTLVAEPFLVVGLIASIRRVLVITLESSQAKPVWKMDLRVPGTAPFHDAGIAGAGWVDPGNGTFDLSVTTQ
jgi:uncharacterized membrane protein (DUF373 family)